MLVGTSTDGKSTSKGIYAFRWNSDTGVPEPLGLAAETLDPQFLVRSPNHRFVYSVNEISHYQGTTTGSVSSFKVDAKSGKLEILNTVSSAAAGPCNLTSVGAGREDNEFWME
jgi:6-phosphogluconolactonase